MSDFTIFNTPGEEWSKRSNSWETFYNNVKDPSWPDCCNEGQFFKLPKHIQEEIVTIHNGGRFIFPTANDFEDLTEVNVTVNNQISEDPTPLLDLRYQVGDNFYVYYDDYMNAGGTGYVQSYSRVLKYCYPDRKFNQCLDWCAGAGFLGFRLLADRICDSVTLMDCFEPSLTACKKTISAMPEIFAGKADLVKASAISNLTPGVKYDLIVGNPPGSTIKRYSNSSIGSSHEFRLAMDLGWKIHKEFFNNVRSVLAPDGVVVLQKFSAVHDISDFEDLIEQNNLKIIKIFREKEIKDFWYFVLTI